MRGKMKNSKIEQVFLGVSVIQMIMARSQVQHTKYTVLLSLLMYFLLLRAFSFFFSFFCNPRLPGVLCWPPGITVLLSLTVFMLMVAEIMPATSDSVPLIGQGFFFRLHVNLHVSVGDFAG